MHPSPTEPGRVRKVWQRFRQLPTWLQIVIGMLLLGLIASPFAEKQAVPPEDAPSARSPAPLPSSTDPTASSTPTATSDTRAQVLDEYLRTNFSSTSWHRYITNVRVRGNAAWIETNLFADADAREPAVGICRGVSSYIFSTSNTIGLTGLTVRAVDGQRLVMRLSISDPC